LSFHNSTLTASAVALLILASASPFVRTAEAAVTFSFSGLVLTNGASGSPLLVMDGSITIPRMSSLPLSDLSADQRTPELTDITISEAGTIIRSFQDPNYFTYDDGIGSNGTYYFDITSIETEDALDDFVGLTFMGSNGEVGGDFSTSTFDPGFYPFHLAPFTVSEVPEPSTWAMLALGFAGLSYAGFRQSRRLA
jgi:hypothetical protein